MEPEQQAQSIHYISTPYIKGASERTAKLLREYGIRLSNKSRNTIGSKLSKLKDKIPKNKKTRIVYQIDCKNCDKKYVGETGRDLNTRMSEHKRNVRNQEENSLIFQHIDRTNHEFNFDEVKILANEENVGTRRFLEACYTIVDPNCINRARDIPDQFLPTIRNKICY